MYFDPRLIMYQNLKAQYNPGNENDQTALSDEELIRRRRQQQLLDANNTFHPFRNMAQPEPTSLGQDIMSAIQGGAFGISGIIPGISGIIPGILSALFKKRN